MDGKELLGKAMALIGVDPAPAPTPTCKHCQTPLPHAAGGCGAGLAGRIAAHQETAARIDAAHRQRRQRGANQPALRFHHANFRNHLGTTPAPAPSSLTAMDAEKRAVDANFDADRG